MKYLKNIFLILFVVCFCFAIKIVQIPETNLLSGFISKNSDEKLLKLSKLSSNQLNIIIKTDNLEENEDIKYLLETKLNSFKKENAVFNNLINIYRDYPTNFLTYEQRQLLEKKDYKTLENKSLTMLYNPLGIFISPIEKDPYLFATSFVLNNQKYLSQDNIYKDGKYYSLIRYECNNINDIKILKEIILEIKNDIPSDVYLAGIPVHTFETQELSKIEINLICIISIIFVILLCRFCLGSVRIFYPAILSILFGFLFGFTFSVLIFHKLHILTLVFSTSLIGIGFDYSLHYFLSKNNSQFKKNLFTSLLSTVIAFGLLFFSNVEILKQIAIFVSLGLIGIYLFVCFMPSIFLKIDYDFNLKNKFNFSIKYKKIVLFLFLIVIFLGLARIHFDDNIKNLYKPKENLKQAEILYEKIFNKNPSNFILVNGKNLDEILKKEENIEDKLRKSNIDYISLSSFISSIERQKENINLVNSLYKKRLNSYAKFLDEKSKKKLLEKKELYNPENYPFKDRFMLDDNTSFIMIFGNTEGTINISSLIVEILKNFRHKCLCFVPLIFVILSFVLRIFYSQKQAIKIILPSFLGGFSALMLISIFNVPINVFHILAYILSIGFSMDYSIFRLNGGKNSNLAVFISCISTSFSFLMLSFTNFKLISSLGLILSFGIISSYILSLLFISVDETENI